MQGRAAVDEACRTCSRSGSVRVVFAVHVFMSTWVCSDSSRDAGFESYSELVLLRWVQDVIYVTETWMTLDIFTSNSWNFQTRYNKTNRT